MPDHKDYPQAFAAAWFPQSSTLSYFIILFSPNSISHTLDPINIYLHTRRKHCADFEVIADDLEQVT